MKTFKFLNQLRSRGRRARVLALAAIAGGLLLAVISCSSVSNQAVVLPDVPGAKYIGSSECEQCHDEIYKGFKTADHARLMTAGPNAKDVGCESCHGPCSLHSDSGGDVKPPYSFTPGRPIPAGLAGTTPGMSPAEAKETVCYQCHADVRGQFELPSHHPVPEGRMDCVLCHSPHKGSIRAGGGTALLSQDDNCLQCHPAQRGPYVFEHEALREGCTTCHTAHGSVNAKLLTVRDSNLCLKCHFQQIQNGAILIGGSNHTVRLQEGSCWTAGCHEAVHGSRVSPSLRF
jgi:predicted CXXCH cytochrome family protein